MSPRRALYRANLLVDNPSFGNHSSSTANASDSTIEELNLDDRDSDTKMTGYQNRLQILRKRKSHDVVNREEVDNTVSKRLRLDKDGPSLQITT